jgi:hypothetical protein
VTSALIPEKNDQGEISRQEFGLAEIHRTAALVERMEEAKTWKRETTVDDRACFTSHVSGEYLLELKNVPLLLNRRGVSRRP